MKSIKWLTSKEAAAYLSYQPVTLNKSRINGKTGLLGGKQAPKFYKIGRSVRYKQSDLDAWVEDE